MSSLLEKGLDAMMEEVDLAIERYPQVITANKQLGGILQDLESVLGAEQLFELDKAINAARAADAYASFRIGTTEGIKLSKDIRSLFEFGIGDSPNER